MGGMAQGGARLQVGRREAGATRTAVTWSGPTTLVANTESISCERSERSVACELTPALWMSRFKPCSFQ